MAQRRRTPLQYNIIHKELPDAARRIAQAFDLILSCAHQQRLAREVRLKTPGDRHG